jgi:hypothetical protein
MTQSKLPLSAISRRFLVIAQNGKGGCTLCLLLSTNYPYKSHPPSPKCFTQSRPPPFPPPAIHSNFTMSTWSLTDNQSTKSWGTPQLPVSSPTVTWGTLPSTTSSTSSLQGVVDHETSWSSPNNGYSQGWTSNTSPPLYPSLGSSHVSVASYSGMHFYFFPLLDIN